VSIKKLSGSEVRKAGAAQEGDWHHTMSANHCLHVYVSRQIMELM